MTKLADFDTKKRFTGTVVETKHLTPADLPEEIKSITLGIEPEHFHFEVGQSVGVVVRGESEFGPYDHLRLYSVAGLNTVDKTIELCVKRCHYIDEINGERYPGLASNILCDLTKGDAVTLCGPFGLPFKIPADRHANLLMIGLGTGIAPFRAFVTHLYQTLGGWEGQVRLFYGAKQGMEMAYLNDLQNDFSQYYTEATFKAFQAVSPRPHMNDPIPIDEPLSANKKEIWSMVLDPNTHIFVAGLEKLSGPLFKAFAEMAGGEEHWKARRAELSAGGRYVELMY